MDRYNNMYVKTLKTAQAHLGLLLSRVKVFPVDAKEIELCRNSFNNLVKELGVLQASLVESEKKESKDAKP